MRGDLGKRLNLHCHGETGPVYSFLTLSKNPCCLNHAESVSVNWSNCLLTFLIPIWKPLVANKFIAPRIRNSQDRQDSHGFEKTNEERWQELAKWPAKTSVQP